MALNWKVKERRPDLWYEIQFTRKYRELKKKCKNIIELELEVMKLQYPAIFHEVEEQDLFENLNGKRVPRDGADLIRAIIITRVAKQEVVEFEGTIKANVILNERRIRIGMALDEMNRWWSQSEVSTYFRYFAKNSIRPFWFPENKSFGTYTKL